MSLGFYDVQLGKWVGNYERFIAVLRQSKKISNDQELIQSGPTSCPKNKKGNS